MKYGFGSIVGFIAACTGRADTAPEPTPSPTQISVQLPQPFEVSIDGQQPFEAVGGKDILVSWTESTGAQTYDVELNGVVTEDLNTGRKLVIGFGSGKVPYQEGMNSIRIRARNTAAELWSDKQTFEIIPVDGIRARHFDHEDDGDIELTVASTGTAIAVGSQFAYGAGSKGVSMKCTDSWDTRAYKNLTQLPVEECWVRLAVRPEIWERDNVRINLARIRSSATSATEHLIWITGKDFRTSNISPGELIIAKKWIQLQFGVKADGTVELWGFDGRREFLIGRGINEGLRGSVKDIVAVGNDFPNSGITYEVWLDEFAVGEQKQPWAKSDDTHTMARPRPIQVAELPPVFSFVFGSCNATSLVPYRETALEAAAEMNPNFLIHLGDYCYPDTRAYAQSKQGYLALWSDLLYEAQLRRLSDKPWLYLASDHDLGGNDIDTETLSPFALEAFDEWHSNDTSADGRGGYGSLEFDGGMIILIWLEGIAFRSPLSQSDGPDKTMLGSEQKRWLFGTLEETSADLIVIASQTTFSHESQTGWAQYPTERLEVLNACRKTGKTIRWISGDFHTARWAKIGKHIAEWGAAPLAEVYQSCASSSNFVDDDMCVSGEPYTTRRETVSNRTMDEIRQQTSFGCVVIDTITKTATFEVRDNQGNIRVAESGFRMTETFQYA